MIQTSLWLLFKSGLQRKRNSRICSNLRCSTQFLIQTPPWLLFKSRRQRRKNVIYAARLIWQPWTTFTYQKNKTLHFSTSFVCLALSFSFSLHVCSSSLHGPCRHLSCSVGALASFASSSANNFAIEDYWRFGLFTTKHCFLVLLTVVVMHYILFKSINRWWNNISCRAICRLLHILFLAHLVIIVSVYRRLQLSTATVDLWLISRLLQSSTHAA